MVALPADLKPTRSPSESAKARRALVCVFLFLGVTFAAIADHPMPPKGHDPPDRGGPFIWGVSRWGGTDCWGLGCTFPSLTDLAANDPRLSMQLKVRDLVAAGIILGGIISGTPHAHDDYHPEASSTTSVASEQILSVSGDALYRADTVPQLSKAAGTSPK
jgi:hypothetical protein